MAQLPEPLGPLHHVLEVGEARDGGRPGDEVHLGGEVLRHLERRGSVVQEMGTVDPEQWKKGWVLDKSSCDVIYPRDIICYLLSEPRVTCDLCQTARSARAADPPPPPHHHHHCVILALT